MIGTPTTSRIPSSLLLQVKKHPKPRTLVPQSWCCKPSPRSAKRELRPYSTATMSAGNQSSSGYSSLSETLHAVTSIKLNELSRQKDRLNEHFAPVLETLPGNGRERLETLYDALR